LFPAEDNRHGYDIILPKSGMQHSLAKNGVHAGLVTLPGALQPFNDIRVKTDIYRLFYRFVICHVSVVGEGFNCASCSLVISGASEKSVFLKALISSSLFFVIGII